MLYCNLKMAYGIGCIVQLCGMVKHHENASNLLPVYADELAG